MEIIEGPEYYSSPLIAWERHVLAIKLRRKQNGGNKRTVA